MEVPVNFDIGNSSGTEPNTSKNNWRSEIRPSSNQSTLSYADLNCEQPLAGLGLQQLEKRTELSCKKELERGKRHIAFSACSCRPEPHSTELLEPGRRRRCRRHCRLPQKRICQKFVTSTALGPAAASAKQQLLQQFWFAAMKIIGKPELHAQLLLCRAVGAGGEAWPTRF